MPRNRKERKETVKKRANSRERRSEGRPLVPHVQEHEEGVLGERLEVLLLVHLRAVLLQDDVDLLVRGVVELVLAWNW